MKDNINNIFFLRFLSRKVLKNRNELFETTQMFLQIKEFSGLGFFYFYFFFR